MPETTKFFSDGMGNGFPFCLKKEDVSGYDYWTTLGGYNKNDADALIEPTGIAESLEKAMKLYWNYNGHSVEFADLSPETLTIDIEQGVFENGSDAAPFEPRDRICKTSGWDFDQTNYPDDDGILININPIRMYNGSTDDEDNFVGYGIFGWADVFDAPFLATNEFESFAFLSYIDGVSGSGETYEYNDAIDGMWLVAAAYGGDDPPVIDGLTVDFIWDEGSITFTYKDFDFYTYPA